MSYTKLTVKKNRKRKQHGESETRRRWFMKETGFYFINPDSRRKSLVKRTHCICFQLKESQLIGVWLRGKEKVDVDPSHKNSSLIELAGKWTKLYGWCSGVYAWIDLLNN